MKKKTFDVPVSTFFQIEAGSVLCNSPETQSTTLPGFGGGPVGDYDDDNPYFGN